MLKLNIINKTPPALLEIENSTDIYKVFDQPTLLTLDCKNCYVKEVENKHPLFISVLLHANEDTGFLAVQQLLRKYEEHELPRSLIIFFGNIAASREGLRRLKGQPDYNRVWPGTLHPESDESRLMQEVVNFVSARQPFASIDIHNNTGKNPHYGCINKLDTAFLQLAALFSRTVVFFETPKGVQSMAMAEHCPSITIECGQPHQPHGIKHAADFVDTVLHLEDLHTTFVDAKNIDIYQTVARVKVPENISFSFTDPTSDILFKSQLDKMNFAELSGETIFGEVQNQSNATLLALDDHEQDVSDEFFINRDNQLILTKPLMPAMLTLDEKIIRQDCLCYLMKRLNVPGVDT